MIIKSDNVYFEVYAMDDFDYFCKKLTRNLKLRDIGGTNQYIIPKQYAEIVPQINVDRIRRLSK